MKRSIKSKVFIIILNLLLLAVFIITTLCYADIFNGGDPLELMFLPLLGIPSLIVLGILLIVFKSRLRIPLVNGLIAFIGIVGIYFPVFFQDTNEWERVGLIGMGMGVALSIITIVTTVAILFLKRNMS